MFINAKDDGVFLKLKIQSNAKNNKICGFFNEYLKVSITSPPVDDAANVCLIKYLAKFFSIKKSAIEIRSGIKGKKKLIFLKGAVKKDVELKVYSVLNQKED